MSRIEFSLPHHGLAASRRPTLPSLTGILRSLAQCMRRNDLAELDARQLHDAGIDPVRAGRAKAVDVSAAELRRMNSLAIG
ncbi:hypothetical protein [Arenibaculum pallidiluteum]|uniref:hypothetical protein n=1 Tax=Arenibaculum pallidiluteum TaxID=2812559 RepID=UPI001A97978D|nr:hypothetical protein [Arenibaculum pallidiluteum]